MLVCFFQASSEKKQQLQQISKILQVFKSDLKVEKQRVVLVLDNQNKTIEKMKKSMKKLRIRKENLSERKILKAVVPKEQIIEHGDDKETIVASNDDKDDSGRESDSSDQPSDDKDTKNNSVKRTKDGNECKTVLSYSYWTHYI